jgi:GT2 family glycosyltransferase
METESAPPVPAVVAVVVTADPGSPLPDTLGSLGQQDYPNLSVLVVDAVAAGTDADPAELSARVAAVLPGAFVRRLERPARFGRAANEVLDIVEGASHFLFCHDDVALAPDAVRLMVEEAFRSNAGIVCPKYVSWLEPDRLLAVGLTTDKVGARHNLVEPGELDQEQHDAVRDVLVAPGGATLVRADLFAALRGYDPGVEDQGEDMDLSWRARLCGARVVVAPQARVRHLESPSCPAPPVSPGAAGQPGRDRLECHRWRTICTCYRGSTLAWLLPLAIFWALGEAVTLSLQGRTSEARGILAAMGAALSPPGRLRRSRSRLQRRRTVGDGDLRALQVRGNARFRIYLRGRLDDVRSGLERQGFGARLAPVDPDGPDPDADGRAVAPPEPDRARRLGRLRWALPVLIVVVWAVGSRSLLGVGLPQVGTLPDTAVGYRAIWSDWWSAWQPVGLGVAAPSSPGLALLGLIGTVLFGAVGTLGHLVVLGPLLVGPLGMWRAARHWTGPVGRLLAAVIYALVPLPYNALAAGRWDALVVFAGLPWVLSAVVGLSSVVPAPVVSRARLGGRLVGLSLLVAAVTSVAPSFPYLLAVLGLALVAGSGLVGRAGGSLRLLGLPVVAGVGAFVLLLPWSATVAASGVALAGPDPGPPGSLSLGQVLRFHTGPFGSGAWELLLLPAAALPLLVGREWRLEWAARAWTVALVFFGWAWAGSHGWVPRLAPDVLLVPAAAALALAAALGVAAFEIDLPAYNFGWRQAAAGGAALCVILAAGPWIVSAGNGRWRLPRADASDALFLPGSQGGDYRVLWVGAPAALPLTSRPLQAGVAYATSFDGQPSLPDDFATGPAGASGQLAIVLRLVEAELTTKAGHLLAPAGVRFVVVPNHVGPQGAGGAAVPVPGALLAGLGLQTDLRVLLSDPDYTVYANAAWAPVRSVLPPDALAEAATGDLRLLQGTDLAGARPVSDGTPVAAGAEVGFGSTYSPGWHLAAGGRSSGPARSFGWAMRFPVVASGPARFSYSAPLSVRFGYVLQVVLWVGGVAVMVGDRRRRRRRPEVEAPDPSWFAPAVASPRPGRRRQSAVPAGGKGTDPDRPGWAAAPVAGGQG